MTPVHINGLPGVITRYGDGSCDTTALEVRDGEIVGVFITRNPDKLKHIMSHMEFYYG